MREEGGRTGPTTETERRRVAQKGFGKMPENGKGGFVAARILFRLEIRKYLGLFYIAPAAVELEGRKRGRETEEEVLKAKLNGKLPGRKSLCLPCIFAR